MMPDIAAARQGYKRQEITNVGLVRSSKNLADVRTKTTNQASMLDFMRAGKILIEPEQWIIQ